MEGLRTFKVLARANFGMVNFDVAAKCESKAAEFARDFLDSDGPVTVEVGTQDGQKLRTFYFERIA